MKKTKNIGTFLLFLFVLATASFQTVAACEFDLDCAIGSQCQKASGSLSGVCTGGMNPGNSNDRRPMQGILGNSAGRGNTCSYSTDCSSGQQCVKGSGLLGACM